ncbi:VPDSG-CTERM sorting domain-containing protein [Neptunomonas sp.]
MIASTTAPQSSTIILLGTGILGLVGFRRKS